MQDDNPEPGHERLRLIYHDRAGVMEPDSANQGSAYRGSDQSEATITSQCELSRMLISEMELSRDCGYTEQENGPRAVLWRGSFINRIKLFQNICVNLDMSPCTGHVRPH